METPKIKVLHILYGGLGGHSAVFNAFVKANTTKYVWAALFYGIEPTRKDSLETCVNNAIPFSEVLKHKGLDIVYFYRVYKQIKTHNPKTIFLHGAYNIVPAFLFKVVNKTKIIVRETQNNALKTKADWLFLFLSFLMANKIVFLNTNHAEEVKQKLGWFYKEYKVHIIPNGLDLTLFTPSLDRDDTHLNLGMISRIVKIKDHETVINALKQLDTKSYFNKIKFYIAGEGENENYLKELVAKLQLEKTVVFLGILSEMECSELLKKLHIYIHATYGEAMSNSIMQAQATGLPIIASDVTGVNNVIKHLKNGILVEVNNWQNMATQIDLLINDTQIRTVLGKASYTYAINNLSNNIMYNRYANII